MTEFNNPTQDPNPAPKYPPPAYPPPVGPPAGAPMYGPTPQPGQPPYPPPQSTVYPPQPGQPVYPPQPGQPVYMPQSGARPSAYWPLSIIAFLLSCLFGGIAMFFSYQVGEKMKTGDVVGAGKASRMAMIFSIVGIVIGGIFLVYALSSGGGY